MVGKMDLKFEFGRLVRFTSLFLVRNDHSLTSKELTTTYLFGFFTLTSQGMAGSIFGQLYWLFAIRKLKNRVRDSVYFCRISQSCNYSIPHSVLEQIVSNCSEFRITSALDIPKLSQHLHLFSLPFHGHA